jgi:hypothetical protein
MKPVVLVLGPGPQPLSEMARHYALVPFETANPLRLGLAIVARDAQIVHLNGAVGGWRELACLLVAKLLGARVVLQLEQLTRNQALLRLADVVVVGSHAEMQACHEWLPGQNVAVVPEAIDSARLADDFTAIYSIVLPWPASQAG